MNKSKKEFVGTGTAQGDLGKREASTTLRCSKIFRGSATSPAALLPRATTIRDSICFVSADCPPECVDHTPVFDGSINGVALTM